MTLDLSVQSNRPGRKKAPANAPTPPGSGGPSAGSPATPAQPAGPVFTPPPQPAAAQSFWTEEKAQKAIAYACRSLVPIAGPDMRASEFELEMAGAPLAAVLGDYWPVPSSESMSTQANLVVLLVVVGFMVLVRLPDLKVAYDKAREGKRRPAPDQPAARVEQPTPLRMTPEPDLEPEPPAPLPASNGRRKTGWELFVDDPSSGGRTVGDGRL